MTWLASSPLPGTGEIIAYICILTLVLFSLLFAARYVVKKVLKQPAKDRFGLGLFVAVSSFFLCGLFGESATATGTFGGRLLIGISIMLVSLVLAIHETRWISMAGWTLTGVSIAVLAHY